MAEKVIYHRETKLIECMCGDVRTSHQCQKNFKKIIFVQCTEECDACTAAEKLIYHRETKLTECICGYIGTSHDCQKDFKKFIFVRCTEGCIIWMG